MTTWIKLVGTAAVALAAIVFLLNVGKERTAAVADVPDPRVEIESLREELARVQRTLKAQGSAVRSAAAQLRENAAQQANPDSEEHHENRRSPAAQAPTVQQPLLHDAEEMLRGLGTSFDQQGIDHQWTSVATPLADAQLRRHLPEGSRLTSVECRESMCRAEVLHRDLDKFHEFTNGLVTSAERKWDGVVMSSLIESVGTSDVRAVVYLGRGNQDLVALASPEE